MALLCGKISTIPRLEKMNSLSSNTDEVINFHLCAPKVGYARLNGENDESSVIPRQALVLGAKLSYQDLETISLPGQTPVATSPASEAPPAKLLRLVNTRGSFAFVFWEKKKKFCGSARIVTG